MYASIAEQRYQIGQKHIIALKTIKDSLSVKTAASSAREPDQDKIDAMNAKEIIATKQNDSPRQEDGKGRRSTMKGVLATCARS